MADRRQKDWGVTLALGAALLALALVSTWQSWFSELDNLVYDSLVRQMNVPVLDDIVVVAIDSKTLATLGRWPLRRDLHAELLEKITAGKPAVVAMDMIFSEPDLQHPQYDRKLVDAIRKSGRVVLPVVLERYSSGSELRESLPFPELRDVVAALGHVHIELEDDGIARSAFLMAGVDRPVWPAFSLAMARVTEDWPESRGFPRSGKTPVYTDLSPNVWRVHRQVLIPFPASGKDLAKISYADVINGNVPANRFYDKYVFVGATAAGLGDNIPTPISAHGRPVSGVEFNAYVLNGLLQDRLIVPISLQWQYIFNALLIISMLLLYRPRGWRWVYGITLLPIIVIGVDYLLLSGFGYWYPPVVMLVSIGLFFLAANGHLLRKLLRVLFEERRLSQTALTAIGEAVIRLDEQGRIIKFNPMAEKLSGMQAEEAEGRDVDEVFRLVFADTGRRFSLHRYLRSDQPSFHQVLALKNAQGDEYQVNVGLSTVPGVNGNAPITVMVLSDVSKEHALASEVTHRETHNALTDLPNQDLIARRLKSALARADMNNKTVAVVYLDIDYFSKINEARGISVGNRLLQAVADKLSDFLGNQVDVGHIGGDEFLLILEEHKIDRPIDDMVGLVFALFARPLHLSEGDIRISVTLGISIYPEHADAPELLIGCASAAMHYGKAEGGGQIIYYEPGMQDRANRALVIEAQLHQALDSGRFDIYYQPLVDAATLKITGVEALSRLKDTSGNNIPPEEFIEVAERTGLIAEMGYQQLYKACVQLEQWRKQGFSLRLSYNFSPRQMSSSNLIEKIERIFKQTGFRPEFMDFEITENVLLSSDELVQRVLTQIQSMGIGVIIDDFGTGYSAMSYLTRFKFDRLKIDKSFVSDLDGQSGSQAITSAIITLAHDLGMGVVAEGVETEQQLELLLSQGCDEVQGYFLARPMPAEQFKEYLVSHKGHIQLASQE